MCAFLTHGGGGVLCCKIRVVQQTLVATLEVVRSQTTNGRVRTGIPVCGGVACRSFVTSDVHGEAPAVS